MHAGRMFPEPSPGVNFSGLPAPPMSAGRRAAQRATGVALAVLVASLPLGVAWWVNGGALDGAPLLDDAYIYVAAARTLRETGRLAVSPHHETLAGLTSPLYAVLLAAGGMALAPGRLARATSLASSVAATLALLALLRAMGASRPAALLATLVLAGSGTLAMHALSGMETTLAVAVLLACCLAWMRAGPGWLSGGLAALLAALRPDGAMLAAALVVATMLQLAWQPPFSWRAESARLGRFLIPLALVALAQTGLFALYLGRPVANSISARILLYCWDGRFVGERLWIAVRDLWTLVGEAPITLPLVLLALIPESGGEGVLQQRRRRVVTALALVVAGYVGLFVLRGVPPDYQFWRYAMPLYAALVVLTGIGLSRAIRGVAQGSRWTRAVTVAMLLGLVLASVRGQGERLTMARDWVRTFRWINRGYQETLQHVGRLAAPGERIGVSDIGQALSVLHQPVVDLAGLTNPEIERYLVDAATGRCLAPERRDLSEIPAHLGLHYVVLGAPWWDGFLGTILPRGARPLEGSAAPARLFRVRGPG